MKKNIIILPFACNAIRNFCKTTVQAPSPTEWEIPLNVVVKVRIRYTDAPSEAAARQFAIDLGNNLELLVTLGGVPLEASYRNGILRAIAGKALLIHASIPLYVSALALLDPLTDLISLCA